MTAKPKQQTSATPAEVFRALKDLFAPVAPYLRANVDTESHYSLESFEATNRGRPMYFGGVKLGKSYVSFHLMPVYGSKALVQSMSPRLKQRMQGKSCFNFNSIDAELFAELREITKTGFEKFRAAKLV